ncbi:MAG TPA: amidohydrolase family protein [Gemmatimonadales bacterium]
MLPFLTAAVLAAAPVPLAFPGDTTVEVTVGVRDPAIHPDGGSIAVSVLGKIWIVPAQGGTARQVTFGVGWDTHPAWSPDGQFLAYAHRLPDGTYIALLNGATGGTRFVHHTEAAIGQIAFTTDGHQLLFVNDRSQYDAHLWRVSVTGTGADQLTHTQNWHEWSFALAPSGDRVLLETGRYGAADLYAIALDDDAITRVTESDEREMSVVWSARGWRAWVATHNGVDEIMVESAGTTRSIFSSAFDDKQLAAHPDGETLVMAAGRRLYGVNVETGAVRPILFRAPITAPVRSASTLVIRDVRVFDPGASELSAPSTVLVEGERIVRVTRDAMAAPPGATVIEGAGRTLLPGLIDNHYHYWSPFAGSQLLARGITSIRDPGVSIADGMDYKDANHLGVIDGPDIYSAGPLIDGPGGYHPRVDVSLDDPAAAGPLVRALKAQGVDLLKVYFLLDPRVLAAVVQAAHDVGLPVTGHIGVRTSWGEAMEAGIDGFSHLRVWRDFLPPELQPNGDDESLDGQKHPIARMQADWRRIDPDAPEVHALIELLVATRTAIDPTLFIQRIGDNARSRMSLEQLAIARAGFERMQRFVRLAVEAGVPLLAGTDNVNLIDELEAYADAGVPPVAILRAATITGARWLGREGEFGSIEPGKRAHLVLVDGDPLEDVSVLRKVDLVVKGGAIVFRR